MRYLVTLLLAVVVAASGMLAAGISVTLTKRKMGMSPDTSELVGWAVGIPVALGVALLVRWWVRRTFKKCPSCDSYVRTAAKRCIYCKADLA